MKSKAPPLPIVAVGIAGRPMPGQTVSGDGHIVVPHPDGVLVGVLDGLGHGPAAAAATKDAQANLESYDGDDLATLIRSCHTQLIGTRGVVMTLAFFSTTSPMMTWLGVGNVEGVVLRADPQRDSIRVVLRGGVVGGSLPSLHSSTVMLSDGDLLVLATDGIAFHSAGAGGIDRSCSPQQIADELLAKFAKSSDDALVLIARWSNSS